MSSIFSECSKTSSEVSNIVFGMPHRGRLNILPLLLDYPVSALLAKINGKRDIPKDIEAIDDVISHVSASNEKTYNLAGLSKGTKPISVSMVHNPSHLEAVNPVVMGKAYAKIKDLEKDCKNNEDAVLKVLNLLIHGDSAVSGQGVIYESLSFHKSPKCDVGGSLHIVTNNQIGYTTQGKLSRASLYW